MAEFYTVKFGSVYFTDDGTSTGQACLTTVTGLDNLQVPYAGAVAKSADNTPYMFVLDFGGQGTEIKIAPMVISASILAALKEVISVAVVTGATINVLIDGDTGSYNLECLPLFKSEGGVKPIEFSGKFFNGQIYDCALNVVVVSAT